MGKGTEDMSASVPAAFDKIRLRLREAEQRGDTSAVDALNRELSRMADLARTETASR